MPARLFVVPVGATIALSALLAACSGDSVSVDRDQLATSDTPSVAEVSSVALLTGDRVHLERGSDGRTAVLVEPAPGRDAIAFAQHRTSRDGVEEIRVVPEDALPLLASGQVDPKLFDVTALARRARNDRRPEGLPLIVRFRPGTSANAARAMVAGVALASIDASAVVEPSASAGALWATLTASHAGRTSLAPGVVNVWLDDVMHPVLDRSAPQVGAPIAWAAGFTGEGATVAVLDSGIDASHPDLQGQIREVRDFTGTAPDGRDDFGHGTHVAGTIAGSGAASTGAYRGVAPGADLLIGKVCVAYECSYSDVLAGMEWAAAHARVVNMSLGGGPTDGTDPVSLAVDALSAQHGTLFVIAAGNEGTDQSVGTPGAASAALTVGSVTKEDTLSDFSSRGPRLGDSAVKPEIAAPGSDIAAARAPGTELGDAFPVGEHYARASGTSMATPHVAGAAAILAAAHPDWDGARLKTTLMAAAAPLEGIAVHAQGAGRLDVAAAVTQAVHASPPALSAGVVRWPHEGAPITRTVTLRNDGATALTLECSLDVRDADGHPAPEGMFTLETARVAIPAGGTGDVVVTVRPIPRTSGVFGGWLRATSGATRAVVPVQVHQEVESYDLTIRQSDRRGVPADEVEVHLSRRGDTEPMEITAFDADGKAVVRLPRERYSTLGFVHAADGGGPDDDSIAMFVNGDVDLDRDTTLVLDARQARPVRATVEARSAVARGSSMEVAFLEDDFAWSMGWSVEGRSYAVPAAPATGQRIHFFSGFELEAGSGLGGGPRGYHLGFWSADGVPQELEHAVRDRDLARVDTTYRGQGVTTSMQRYFRGFVPGLYASGVPRARPLAVPSTQTLYATVADGLLWGTTIVSSESEPTDVWRGERSYRRGRQSEDWSRVAVGPGFRATERIRDAVRIGNTMSIDVPLFSPGEAGHTIHSPGIELRTTLWRNGEPIGSWTGAPALFRVPAERAAYALEMRASHLVPWSVLDTEVEATWTFASERSVAPSPLPLLAVRASGGSDLQGAAPAGRPYLLTLRAERQAGVPALPVTELALDVSYDAGATWRPTPLLRVGDHAYALLVHPRTAGFVSLRTRAADSGGNTLRQTVIRAYRTR